MVSSFTHKRDELQISQSFSPRKMACVIGKKTHLGSPAALWWKVRSQPKQSQRLRLAHHLETQSSNKQVSTAIVVYPSNDQSHHDEGRGKKLIYESNYSKNTFFQEVRGCKSGPAWGKIKVDNIHSKSQLHFQVNRSAPKTAVGQGEQSLGVLVLWLIAMNHCLQPLHSQCICHT